MAIDISDLLKIPVPNLNALVVGFADKEETIKAANRAVFQLTNIVADGSKGHGLGTNFNKADQIIRYSESLIAHISSKTHNSFNHVFIDSDGMWNPDDSNSYATLLEEIKALNIGTGVVFMKSSFYWDLGDSTEDEVKGDERFIYVEFEPRAAQVEPEPGERLSAIIAGFQVHENAVNAGNEIVERLTGIAVDHRVDSFQLAKAAAILKNSDSSIMSIYPKMDPTAYYLIAESRVKWDPKDRSSYADFARELKSLEIGQMISLMSSADATSPQPPSHYDDLTGVRVIAISVKD